MKFGVVAAVAAGAALASASPLRVIVVSSNVNAVAEPNNPFSKVRFGHAVHESNVAQMMEGGPPIRAPDAPWPFPPGPPGGPPHPHEHFPHFPHPPPNMRPGRPCGMRRPGGFKQKAIDISNAFRKTFGLPLIETNFELTPIVQHHHHHGGPVDIGSGGKEIHGGMVHIMPFIGTPEGTWGHDGEDKEFGGWVNHPPGGPGGPPGGPHHHYPPLPPPPFPPPPPPPPFFWQPPPHRHHGHHGPHHGLQRMDVDVDDSFMVRLQNALMSLGPWEGRAVAFVVGAGLGVLLRMFWVLGVVAYRGCSSTDGKEYAAINDEDSDDDDDDDNVVLGTRYNRRTPVSAPPQYVYPVDEKVRVEEEATTPEVQKSPAPVAGDN